VRSSSSRKSSHFLGRQLIQQPPKSLLNPKDVRELRESPAAVAENEREQISARTKAALAAAKARGVRLGAHGRILADQAIEEAVKFSKPLENDVRDIIATGASNLREVAAGLNARSIPARQGGLWYASNTAVLMRRLGLSVTT
jgi:hypothetical protein